MGLHKKVDGDGIDGRHLSVSPLLDEKVIVPKHRLADVPMLPEMAYEIDLKRVLVRLEKQSSPTHDESYAGFAH